MAGEPRGGAAQEAVAEVVQNGLSLAFAVEAPVIAAARDFRARATFSNVSNRPVRLNALFLGIPQVLLKLRRAGDGPPVHPGPPPVPPVDDGVAGRVTLPPGGSTSFEYGGSLFDTPLPPGAYEVRFRHEAPPSQGGDWAGLLETPWLRFRVR